MDFRSNRRGNSRFVAFYEDLTSGILEFAESEFKLNSIEDGKSVREHLTVAWQATGRKPPQLNQPELHTLIAYIWGWFTELHACRGSNGYGPSPISYSDMYYWSRLKGIDLRKWEINTICSIDSIYIQKSQKSTKQ